MNLEKAWYLIYTKPRQEGVAKTNLERQGYAIYLPLAYEYRRRHDKRARTIAPLFPRYLFIELTQYLDNWAPIRSTLGVSTLVRFGMEPAVVPGDLVETLQARVGPEGVIDLTATVGFKPGSRVRIAEGGMTGYEGIFLAKASHDRVIILLDIVGKQVRVQVDAAYIETRLPH